VYIYNPIEENRIIQTIFAQSANVFTSLQGDIIFDLQNGEILTFSIDYNLFLYLHLTLWFVQTFSLTVILTMVLFISNFNYTKELVALKTLGVKTKKFLSWLTIGLVLSISSFLLQCSLTV
jgi:hypothetical protein